MPKLEFNQEEIDNYFKERAFHVYYKDAIEIADRMKPHAEGTFPEKLLSERRPNEPMEVLEYRKKIFTAKTKPTFLKIFASLQKIRRSSDWSIRYEGEFKRILEGETLEDYTTSGYPVFTSLTNWVFTLMLRKYLIDPNAVVFVYPEIAEVVENEYLKPTAEVFDSKNVIDFVEDDFAVLLNPTGAVYYVRGKPFRGKRYFVVTTQTIFIYDQTDGRGSYELSSQYNHGFDALPVFKLKGIITDQNQGQYLYESRISGIIPELDEALREYSDLQAAKVLHIYPERWEVTQSECTTCKGTGIRPNPAYTGPDCGCAAELQCGSCEGRAYKVAGPYAKIMVKPAGMGEQNIPTPPAGYVEKDVEIVKIMEESIEGHIRNALAAINFEFLASTPLSQSGVAKEVDKDELNNTVHSIAEDIVSAMDNIMWFIARYRYSIQYKPEEINMMVPVISVPEKYDILSSDHLQEELKGAKDSKFNPVLLNAMEREYASKKFNSDPAVSDMVQLVLSLDPLPNVSEDDKMSRLSNNGISKETYVISSNIQEFVRRAIEQDKNFIDQKVPEQRAVMIKYASEEMGKMEASIEEPDSGLDDYGFPITE